MTCCRGLGWLLCHLDNALHAARIPLRPICYWHDRRIMWPDAD